MSKENLVKLMQAAAEDEQLQQQLQNVDSYEDVKTLARQQSLDLGDLSEAEAARTIGVATGEISDELSDDELEMVAGGVRETYPWMNSIQLSKIIVAQGGGSGI